MRDLTMHELDAQLAEQLPARELMGVNVIRGSFNHVGNGNGTDSGNGVGNHSPGTANHSGNGVGNDSWGGSSSSNGISSTNGNGNGVITVVQGSYNSYDF
jgi:hypothetical protein